MTGAPQQKATFTTGSTMRHVVVMTSTASVGLVSVFFVDLLNLFYISLLGQQELAAAIGYAATIMFFSVSFCIGISIAAAALVARALGAEDHVMARQMAASSLVFLLVITIGIAILLYPSVSFFLTLLGARGETLQLAIGFMQIVIPSIPLLGLGMWFGGLLRARGDARRAMYVTLGGAAAALVIDPLLIIVMDLGLTGAAIATLLTRSILVVIGYWGVQRVHKMIGRISLSAMKTDLRPFVAIAAPAITTQLATPLGNAYVTGTIATFGDDAVAGWAIIGRVLPVAFGTIFALTGAVGPILSQNYGAHLFPRVNRALRDALTFTLIYTLVVWMLLALGNNLIIDLFGAKGDAADLVRIFCFFVAGSFLFNGALFVANAAFNNLGFPLLATVFNWGRATLGIIPFVYVGQDWGPEGVLIGWGLGALFFGTASVFTAFRVIKRLPERAAREQAAINPQFPPTANSPFTSGKGAASG